MQSFVCLEKNRAIAGPWSSKGCSQEYLGNLPPSLTLIILFFTALLNWDSPGSTFPKQRTKGFPWEWGLAMSAQWAVYKLCSTAGWLSFSWSCRRNSGEWPGLWSWSALFFWSCLALGESGKQEGPLLFAEAASSSTRTKTVSSLRVCLYPSRKT